MKNYSLMTVIVAATGLCLSAGNALGIEFTDTFPGDSLDTEKWTPIVYGGTVAVNDNLYLSTALENNEASVQSVPEFDFHANSFQYTINFEFPNPATTNDPDLSGWNASNYNTFRLYFAIGPATSTSTAPGGLRAANGDDFHFFLRWRNTDRLDLLSHDTTLGIPTTNLAGGAPTSVVIDLDATNYSITLVGSTFEGGGSVLSGAHGLIGPLDSYNLLILETQGGAANGTSNTATINSVTVSGVPEPAAFAAVLGLMGLGFVGWRRFRR